MRILENGRERAIWGASAVNQHGTRYEEGCFLGGACCPPAGLASPGTDDVPTEKVLTKSSSRSVFSSPNQSQTRQTDSRAEKKTTTRGNDVIPIPTNSLDEKGDPEETESPSCELVGATGFEPAVDPLCTNDLRQSIDEKSQESIEIGAETSRDAGTEDAPARNI